MHHIQQTRTYTLATNEACIVVVADTHGRPHPALLEQVRKQNPTLILHAGDIGDGPLLDELAAIAPLEAVRGNVDSRDLALPDSVDLCVERPDQPRLRILLTHVAIYRVHLMKHVRHRAQAADAQLVVFGHSHLPFVGRDGRFALFNPGSAGPRRFRLPITFGVLTLGAGGLDLHHVDSENGGPWKPA